MKISPSCLFLPGLIALVAVVPGLFAQAQAGKRKGPTSKIYIAETKGETQIQNGDRIYTAKQATAFEAPGTVIETQPEAHDALVYSNGTGMFVDASTRVEIARFDQEPFRPERNNQLDSPYEPSMSQSDVFLSYGAVGICTSQLVSGSAMLYSTPLASINIRGGKVSIESHPTETIVDLLEGDLTIRHRGKDVGGQILRPGERAIIRPAAAPGREPSITIGPIPREALQRADDRVAMACNARKTVTFEILERLAEAGPDESAAAGPTPADGTEPAGEGEAAGADSPQEIVPRPTVPLTPPTNIVVSPDRLPGT